MRAEDALVAAAVVATHYLSFAVSAKSVVEHGPSIKPEGLFNKLDLSILVWITPKLVNYQSLIL